MEDRKKRELEYLKKRIKVYELSIKRKEEEINELMKDEKVKKYIEIANKDDKESKDEMRKLLEDKSVGIYILLNRANSIFGEDVKLMKEEYRNKKSNKKKLCIDKESKKEA